METKERLIEYWNNICKPLIYGFSVNDSIETTNRKAHDLFWITKNPICSGTEYDVILSNSPYMPYYKKFVVALRCLFGLTGEQDYTIYAAEIYPEDDFSTIEKCIAIIESLADQVFSEGGVLHQE